MFVNQLLCQGITGQCQTRGPLKSKYYLRGEIMHLVRIGCVTITVYYNHVA